ncbi:universal stress protein [Catalinimonas alkaloidigena]|nr:universal stress protein [Catalinimonas alkaloidigena]
MIRGILVPTDFSTCAEQALHYALTLAERSGAYLVFCHTLHAPLATEPAPKRVQQLRHMRDAAEHNFQELQKRLPMLGNLPSVFRIEEGNLQDHLRHCIPDDRIDLIVMGTRGADGIAELLGSNTSDTIRRAPCPVLAVPENAPLRPVRRIAFATDATALRPEALQPLADLVALLDAELQVVYVEATSARPGTAAHPNRSVLEAAFPQASVSFHQIAHPRVEEGLAIFMTQHATDLLAMMPRSHTFFDRLFKGSHTHRMALHSTVPLFTFREN